MSKKSRKRNKKILAALALAGGAALMAKRRKASIADMDDAGIGVTHSALKTPWISKKSDTAADVLPESKPIIGSGGGGIHQGKPPKGAMLKERRYSALNKIPPSMRGGAPYAQGATTFMPPNRQWPGGYVKGTFKKGGRVTGIAKRGFGRALMKGKK